MNLDSLDISEFHPYGDTIFMIGHDTHAAVKKDFWIVSFDGAKNWDTIIPPEPLANGYRIGFFGDEPKIWFIAQDSTIRFYTSADGKHYQKTEIGKDSTNTMGQLDNFFIDPHDPNHWFWIGHGNNYGGWHNRNLEQSFDRGQTWEFVKYPPFFSGKTQLELKFDSRQPGVWYLRIDVIEFIDEYEEVLRTNDNGKSFVNVKHWGTHYGIGGPDEVRKWWGYTGNDNWGWTHQIIYGPLIGLSTDSSLVPNNWLQKFHPFLPLANPSSGYLRRLFGYTEEGILYYPNNYLVFNSDPSKATVVELENKWDTISNNTKYMNSWIYQTEDDWKTWNTIWESGPMEYVSKTFLDEKTPALWAASILLLDSTYSSRYTSFLYKHTLKSSVASEKNIITNYLTAFPTPSNGNINVKLPEGSTRVISLTLLDVTGKSRSETSKDFFFSDGIIKWILPENISSGFYFLKIKTNFFTYLVKIVLQR